MADASAAGLHAGHESEAAKVCRQVSNPVMELPDRKLQEIAGLLALLAEAGSAGWTRAGSCTEAINPLLS